MSYIYLASPYSADPHNLHMQTERFVAHCLREGITIFSPIVHCHELALRHDVPKDFAFWRDFNFAMLSPAKELWVLCLPGWKASAGVQGEIEQARQLKKQITYIRALNGAPPSIVEIEKESAKETDYVDFS